MRTYCLLVMRNSCLLAYTSGSHQQVGHTVALGRACEYVRYHTRAFTHCESNEFSCQARERCPSLRDDHSYFLFTLALYGCYHQETNCALEEWATSSDGQTWYYSWMKIFRMANKLPVRLLILAACLSIPPYRIRSYPALLDPLLELGIFVERRGPCNKTTILERAALSALRVLADKDFQQRLSERQKREYTHLGQLLVSQIDKYSAHDKCETRLGPLEGGLDRYWDTSFTGLGHSEALDAVHQELSKAERRLQSFVDKGNDHDEWSEGDGWMDSGRRIE
jgi:hypothetical protein